MKRPIQRNAKGRFEKGSSGNPFGRPIRAQRRNTPDASRNDFLELMNAPYTISERGKRKTVTASQALDRKLLALALGGSRIAINQIKAREALHQNQIFKEITDLFEEVTNGERAIRERPDDVTDDFVELIRQARTVLDGHIYVKKRS